MSLRIAKGDVVRFRGTDRVGTVQGWATNGTDAVIEVKEGQGVANVEASRLEAVASARFTPRGWRLLATPVLVLLSALMAFSVGLGAHRGELPVWGLVVLVLTLWGHIASFLYRTFIRPPKTKVG